MPSEMKKKLLYYFNTPIVIFKTNQAKIYGNSEWKIKMNMWRAKFESLQLHADEKHATSNATQLTLVSLQKRFQWHFK